MFFLFALFLWPVALIVVLLSHDRSQSAQAAAPAPVTHGLDPLERLEMLAKLRDSGAVTNEEYDAEKEKILQGREAGSA